MDCILIGITGPSGSGKSLIAEALGDNMTAGQATIIQEDAYYKDLSEIPFDERTRYNFDHPDAFDHHLLTQNIQDLSIGKSVQQPIYDFTTHTRKHETRRIVPQKWIILEGILIFLLPELRNLLRFKIYVDTPLDTCFIRRLKRDILERGRSVDSVIQQYLTTVRPMYFKFIEPVKKYADILISNDGQNPEEIKKISLRLKQDIDKMLGA